MHNEPSLSSACCPSDRPRTPRKASCPQRGSAWCLDSSLSLRWAVAWRLGPDKVPHPSPGGPQKCLRWEVWGKAEAVLGPQHPKLSPGRTFYLWPNCLSGGEMDVRLPFGRL